MTRLGLGRLLAVIAFLGLACAGSAGALLRLPKPLPATTLDLPVLMYHRVGPILPTLPPITQRLTVSSEDFAAQMTWLRGHGFHAVSARQAFEALEYRKPLPPRPVLITFDDGYRDVLWHAAPVLHRLRMPATAFVITDRISGGDTSFLTWPQLTRLERLGVAIGSHTVSHLDLTTLSGTALWRELRDSRRVLEQHLGHPVQWFAYPAGAENASVVALAQKAGYVLAVTTEPGSLQSASQPLLLHRYEVLDKTGAGGLAEFLSR